MLSRICSRSSTRSLSTAWFPFRTFSQAGSSTQKWILKSHGLLQNPNSTSILTFCGIIETTHLFRIICLRNPVQNVLANGAVAQVKLVAMLANMRRSSASGLLMLRYLDANPISLDGFSWLFVEDGLLRWLGFRCAEPPYLKQRTV